VYIRVPDGLFSYKFGYILEGLGMDKFGIFNIHLEYFTALWYTYFMAIRYVCGHLVFFHFLVCCTKKNLATLMYVQRPFLSKYAVNARQFLVAKYTLL
jgi:hypothetical protein